MSFAFELRKSRELTGRMYVYPESILPLFYDSHCYQDSQCVGVLYPSPKRFSSNKPRLATYIWENQAPLLSLLSRRNRSLTLDDINPYNIQDSGHKNFCIDSATTRPLSRLGTSWRFDKILPKTKERETKQNGSWSWKWIDVFYKSFYLLQHILSCAAFPNYSTRQGSFTERDSNSAKPSKCPTIQ